MQVSELNKSKLHQKVTVTNLDRVRLVCSWYLFFVVCLLLLDFEFFDYAGFFFVCDFGGYVEELGETGFLDAGFE